MFCLVLRKPPSGIIRADPDDCIGRSLVIYLATKDLFAYEPLGELVERTAQRIVYDECQEILTTFTPDKM